MNIRGVPGRISALSIHSSEISFIEEIFAVELRRESQGKLTKRGVWVLWSRTPTPIVKGVDLSPGGHLPHVRDNEGCRIVQPLLQA